MLAKYSIRTKITAVVAFLLVAMSLMGALNIRQMYAINSSTTDITTNWLPSIRVLGELRAATITYRAIVRSHLLAGDEAGNQSGKKGADHSRSHFIFRQSVGQTQRQLNFK